MSAKFWTENFDNQQVTLYNLPSYPQNYVMFFEPTLCFSSYVPTKPPPNNYIRCPQKPIVTVQQLGRLGNQIYEYISVWAAAKKTGR